jgi:hypothetical protein
MVSARSAASAEDLLAADCDERGVQQPIALQDPFPDQRIDDRRQQDRKEIDGTKEATATDPHVQDERGDEGEGHHGYQLEDREAQRIGNAAPEMIDPARSGIEERAAIEQVAVLIGGNNDSPPVNEYTRSIASGTKTNSEKKARYGSRKT